MKRLMLVAAVLVGVVSMASSAGANTVAFVQTIGADTITYTLTYPNTANGSGTLTIKNTTDVSPVGGDVYVGDAIFKLDGGTPADLTLTSKPNATWQVTDGNTNSSVMLIGGGGTLNQSARQDGFSGFYSTDVASLPGSFTGLLCITCTPTTYTFNFDYTGATSFGDQAFQAILYNGTGNPSFDTILSVTLTAVPEPTSLALVGSALVGIGVWARRRWGLWPA